jgi:hypothetical protein
MYRGSSTQKAYDEAFLACSTAVYFESQVRSPTGARTLSQGFILTRTPTEQRTRSASLLEECTRSDLLPQCLPCPVRVAAIVRDREGTGRITAPVGAAVQGARRPTRDS